MPFPKLTKLPQSVVNTLTPQTEVKDIPATRPQISKRAKFDYFRWYVIQVMPNLQHLAQFHLSNQDFKSFFPRIYIRQTPSVTNIEPLFKGYGFVYFDPKQTLNWRSINSTRGVVSLVPKHALIPEPVPEGFVEFLINHDPITEILFDQTLDQFYPGLRVRVKDDAHILNNKEGTVSMDRGKYVEIFFYTNSNPGSAMLISKKSIVPL
jgi:transcription antitermination factor NusG